MSLKNKLFEFDKKAGLRHCESNEKLIIGTDEAGRGPGAGGVFASAVYFNDLNDELIEKLSKLNDSKKLSKKAREELFEIIKETTINSTVCIEVAEIEKINILNASLKAMKLACKNVIKDIQAKDILVLVDGNKLIKDFYPCPPSPLAGEGRVRGISQEFIIKGDSKSASIAAASILAKVSRDKYMDELDAKFPQYNWKKNAGYLTKQHLNAIDEFELLLATENHS